MNDRNGYRQIISNKSQVFLFGKYKLSPVWFVLEHDPEYILWLSDEKIVQFPEKILTDAEEFMYERYEWMNYADQYYWTDDD